MTYAGSRNSENASTIKNTVKRALLAGLVGTFMISGDVLAQTDDDDTAAEQRVTNRGEGVSGDIDRKRRSPLVTATTVISGGTVKLLVDAEVPHDDFKKYPIQFDFYVNRRFFTSQIRSAELPGPIGIDVGPDVAVTPFNFSIVAKVLHPNRTFTTVFNGAAFSSNLSRQFDCTLFIADITTDDDEDGVTFVANDVVSSQTSNNVIGVSFEDVDSTDGAQEADLDSTFTISDNAEDNNVTGSLTITRGDVTNQFAVTGIAEVTDGEIVTLDVETEDGTTTLSCE